MRGQQPQAPSDLRRPPRAQPRPGGGGVGHIRDVLRTDWPEPVSQECLLPGGHSHRRHEPEVTKGRSGEGDAEEGGDGLETVCWLLEHSLHWTILGGNISDTENIISVD